MKCSRTGPILFDLSQAACCASSASTRAAASSAAAAGMVGRVGVVPTLAAVNRYLTSGPELLRAFSKHQYFAAIARYRSRASANWQTTASGLRRQCGAFEGG